MSSVVRIGVVVLALALLGAGGVLAYVAVIAIRRSEGVFLPAGYVGLGLLAGGAYLLRLAGRG
jgi:hypothetical protein